MLPYTHRTNFYDKILINYSSSRNDPVISCDNIQISFSNVFEQFLRIKLSTRKHKEYYPHQSVDSKNSADLRLQLDASADHMLKYGNIVIKHVDFCGSVHTHCITTLTDATCHTNRVQFVHVALRCRTQLYPSDNNGK